MQSSTTTESHGEPERLLQARLPAHLVKALRLLAVEQDTTVKELLTQIVQAYVARSRSTRGNSA
jgi:hypothetical protein